MLSKNHPIILFIDRNGFSLYQDILTNIPKFNFTPDLISNLDVVNKEQFVNLIATFIQINKIVGSSLAVILSDNVIYVKDLVSPVQKPTLDQGLHKDEAQNFLENIPFEEVLAKIIKTGNVGRIVAVNKDLVMTIVDTFVSKGSAIEAITPSFMYGQSADFTQGLNLDNVRVILGNTETLRLGNLLTDQEKIIPSQNLESELKNPPSDAKSDLDNGVKKPQNFRQYIFIGVLVTLLVIFAVVYLNLGVSQTPPVKKVKNSASTINTTTPPTGEPTLALAIITAIPLDIKSIKIKIIQSFQIDEKAENLKSRLLNMGLADITSEVSEVSTPEKSSVVFSRNIPTNLRSNIIAEIKKILPSVSILENQDVNLIITIILGKS